MKIFSLTLLSLVAATSAKAEGNLLQPPETIVQEVIVSGYQPAIYNDGIFKTEDGKVIKVFCGHNTLTKYSSLFVTIVGSDNRLKSKFDKYDRLMDQFNMPMDEKICEAQVGLVLDALSQGRKVTMTASGFSSAHIRIQFFE